GSAEFAPFCGHPTRPLRRPRCLLAIWCNAGGPGWALARCRALRGASASRPFGRPVRPLRKVPIELVLAVHGRPADRAALERALAESRLSRTRSPRALARVPPDSTTEDAAVRRCDARSGCERLTSMNCRPRRP